MVRQLVPQPKGTQTPRMEPRAATQLGVQPRLSGYLVNLASRLAAGQRTLTPLTVVRVHPRHFERFKLHEMFAVAAANVIKQPVYRSMTAAPSLAVPRATKHTVFANFRSFVGET